ncbi:MAG: hypothetical protein DMG27_14375 [Acidobacteria bacterium]|nr:MAG: hypothetical protein DMG27_14375 [Acidobacteriota bacterium]
MIQHNVGLTSRKQYFDEIKHMGDLFLDPDTGIATEKVKNISQYVRPSEIERLLCGSDRLLAVYRAFAPKPSPAASTQYAAH